MHFTNNLSQLLKYSVILALSIVAANHLRGAVNPDLTSPRIGDQAPVAKLKQAPSFTDSLSLSPDLTDINVDYYVDLYVWQPSKADTVATCVMGIGRNILALRSHGDTLWQTARFSPGHARYFDLPPTFNVPGTTPLTETVRSHGHGDDIGRYTSDGTQTSRLFQGLTLVAEDGDTLKNVECVQKEINERFVFDNGETNLSRSTIRKWFAPGYRYPLLFNMKNVLLNENADTLDVDTMWYAMTPWMQEYYIREDSDNEESRQWQTRQRLRSNPSATVKHARSPIPPQNGVKHASELKTLTVTVSVTEAQDIDSWNDFYNYTLCDISGKVYNSSGRITRKLCVPKDTFTIDIKDLPPGDYILNVSYIGDPIVFKFKVQ